MQEKPERIKKQISENDIDCAAQIPRLVEDVAAWKEWRSLEGHSFKQNFEHLFLRYPSFRSLTIYRFRLAGFSVTGLPGLRMANDLYIQCPDISGGFRIQHGHSTWVMADRIGRNFLVNQNVTIGVANGGRPTIGDDVSIRTGAVVVGAVRIGNGVSIAPNSFVNFNVPDGKRVFPARSIVI